MPKELILLVDDEEDILELIRYNLQKEGYRVIGVTTGEEALVQARSEPVNLILLDLMLPGSVDGFEACKSLKRDNKTAHIPIIMISAKGEETDIVTGLELGAEDYITKPFSPRILVARTRAALRRKKKSSDEAESVKIHNLIIDPSRFEVLVDNVPVTLTATEFQILKFLSNHPGWVFTRAQIIDAVKGSDYPVTDRSVDVQIVGLRKKLKTAGIYIETVRGIGYRFKE